MRRSYLRPPKSQTIAGGARRRPEVGLSRREGAIRQTPGPDTSCTRPVVERNLSITEWPAIRKLTQYGELLRVYSPPSPRDIIKSYAGPAVACREPAGALRGVGTPVLMGLKSWN